MNDTTMKKRKKKITKTKKRRKKPKVVVDIFSRAAMDNLYYIAHNAPHALVLRGFRWPGLKKKKTRRGRKKRKVKR